jgi:hypothetical protein
MLGILDLESTLPTPPTTFFEKTHFLVTHFTYAHGPTSVIAFGSLGVLLVIRTIKGIVRSYCTTSSCEGSGVDTDKDISNGTNSENERPPLLIAALKPLLPLPEILLVILLTTLLTSTLRLAEPPYNIEVLGRITISTHQTSLIDFPIKPHDRRNWKWVHKTTGTSV